MYDTLTSTVASISASDGPPPHAVTTATNTNPSASTDVCLTRKAMPKYTQGDQEGAMVVGWVLGILIATAWNV